MLSLVPVEVISLEVASVAVDWNVVENDGSFVVSSTAKYLSTNAAIWLNLPDSIQSMIPETSRTLTIVS